MNLDSALIALFAIHLIAFARLLVKRGLRYLPPTATFTVLVAAYTTKLLAPHWDWGSYPAYQVLRIAAIGLAIVSVGLLLRRIVSGRHRQAGDQQVR